MCGFHANGYDEAEGAVAKEYEDMLSLLLQKLGEVSTDELDARNQIDQEIFRCKETYNKMLESLGRSLF